MAEIKSLFAPDGDLEPDVLGELESMVRLHNISAEDLYFKWESYCISMDRDAQDVGLVAVRQLKQSMQDALETSQRQQVKSERKMLSAKTKPRGMGMLDGLVSMPSMPSTPTSGTDRRIQTPGSGTIRRKTEAASDAMKALSVRAQPGEVLEVLNETLAAATPPDGAYAEPRIKLTAASDQKKMGYKTMAMKLSEASEMLDERIEEFSELVREHHGLEESALGNAATAGTAEIVAVGRIASDSLEGRLNAASMVLETSRGAGRGLRVPLNLGGVRDWAFFPGQMVALRGGNASGKEFTVREVLEMPLLPSAASTPAVLAAHRERMRGDAMDVDEPRPLSIVYASGPYTPDANLDYEPLRALCAQAVETLADALVLTGPFLDADHPLIATGDFDLPDAEAGDTATMATAFRHLVAPAIQQLAAANPSMAIILVPSVRDVLNRHVAWPQDALVRRELGLPKSVRVVSNPMTLSLNEVVLAVSSQDVLFELRSEEVSRGGVARDVMGRLARYLIEQRHYFPVFPPVARERLPRTGTEEGVGTGAVLDLGYLKLGEMVSVRPDVMMVPSSLPPFAKVIESVVVINPGHLSKRRGPGTFARMTLHAPSTSGETVDGVACHEVFNRARVEIVRI